MYVKSSLKSKYLHRSKKLERVYKCANSNKIRLFSQMGTGQRKEALTCFSLDWNQSAGCTLKVFSASCSRLSYVTKCDQEMDPQGIIIRYDLSSLSPQREEVCTTTSADIDSGKELMGLNFIWSINLSSGTDVDGSSRDGGVRERSGMRESCVWGRELLMGVYGYRKLHVRDTQRSAERDFIKDQFTYIYFSGI